MSWKIRLVGWESRLQKLGKYLRLIAIQRMSSNLIIPTSHFSAVSAVIVLFIGNIWMMIWAKGVLVLLRLMVSKDSVDLRSCRGTTNIRCDQLSSGYCLATPSFYSSSMRDIEPGGRFAVWEELRRFWSFAFSVGPVSGTVSVVFLLWGLARMIEYVWLQAQEALSSDRLPSADSGELGLSVEDSSKDIPESEETAVESLQAELKDIAPPEISQPEAVTSVSPNPTVSPMDELVATTVDTSSKSESEDMSSSLRNLDPITAMLFGDSPSAESIRST